MAATLLAYIAVAAGLFASATAAPKQAEQLMRNDKYPGASSEIRRVSIDPHSNMIGEAKPKSLSEMGSVEDAEVQVVSEAQLGDSSEYNPCSYLGCNSHTCAWASGGVITRLVAGKMCTNALALGSADITPVAADAKAAAQSGVKISTLKDCLNAVKNQGTSCSGHFQMHKDTWSCSCVPAGSTCAEAADENVCRYQVVEH